MIYTFSFHDQKVIWSLDHFGKKWIQTDTTLGLEDRNVQGEEKEGDSNSEGITQ